MAGRTPAWLNHICDMCQQPLAIPNPTLTEEEEEDFHRTDEDHGFPIYECSTYDGTKSLPAYQRAYLKEHPHIIDETQLKCGHRFHRECLERHYGGDVEGNREMWKFCPLGTEKCSVVELNRQGRLIVCYRNEEGITRRLDLSYEYEGGDFSPDRITLRKELNLLQAIERGDYDTVHSLLEEDISPDITYQGDGYSALHLAALHDRVEIARLLLEYGASTFHDWGTTQDDGGRLFRKTPYDIAWTAGSEEMVKLLSEHEQSRPPRPNRPSYGPYRWASDYED